ncbi:MAG TPA: tetratricopeptide repeat protein [Kofleriaceae bacterium]
MKLLGALVVLLCAGCPNQALNDSIRFMNEGHKAAGAKQFEVAVQEYTKAVEKYSDNHGAHYGIGGAQAARGEWDKAADAFARAVQIADNQPMYQMWYGISLFEKAKKQAREDQAKKENKKPEEIQADLSAVNFDKAATHLNEAIKINADMWRAHYYMGQIYRATDKPKEAATSFSKALQGDPRQQAPYVALGELYRKWDYTDEAIKVTSQGAVNVPGANEVSDIWYVLGMGYDDKNQWDKAIEAFDKSIESKRDNHKAKFQRGQAYFKKGDMTRAKRDLEEFSKSGGASLEFAKQQAQKMLMDIAAKSMGTEKPGDSAPKLSPEQLMKQEKAAQEAEAKKKKGKKK